MSFTRINLPSTISFVSIDTRTAPNKVVMLPAASTVSGRLFTIKDQYGGAGLSTYMLSTVGMDKIDGRNWVYTFSNSYGAISFLSDGRVGWRVVGLYDGSSTAIPPVVSGGVFSPTSITGLQVWLDGKDPAGTGTAPANGATISTWVDKSGNSRNFTASVAATYSSAYTSVSFANSLYSSSYTAAPTAETAFIVFNYASGGGGALVAGYSGARGIWCGNSGGGANSVGVVNTLIAWLAVTSSGTTTAATTTLTTARIASGSSFISLNGSTTFASGGTGFTGGTVTWLGREAGSSFGYTGYAMEIIFYNSDLSLANRQIVEGYLAWKWGFQASLAAGHPYLNAAPGATGYTYSFTGYTNSPGNPISYINSSSVTNGATTFSGSAGVSETNVFYSYTNDIAAPVAKGVTKNSSRDTINLPANTTGTQTTFLSYGPYNTSYTLAGSMPTGFSASAHTVIMIMYHLGTTAALGGSSGQGNNNSVASGGILYQMGRSSVAGNFAINGQVVVGENGAWDYNGGFFMSINATTVNIQSKVGWVMVAFVWRAGNTCAYYYNGSTAMSSGGGNGASAVAGTIYIGVDQRATYYNGVPGSCLNAEIAFYGLWNSALTATQIGAFYTQHSAQFSGGFV